MDNLPFTVQYPGFLFLLLLVPVFWLMARRSLAGLPPLRRVMALGLRILIVVALIFACARVKWRSTADRVAVYFLLDWSDSIPTSPSDFRKEILAYMVKASETRRKGDLAGVIYFGRDATCDTPPAPYIPSTERQAIIDSTATDIASAIRLAVSTFPLGVKKRIVIFTDANQNQGDALSEIETARAQGIQIDVYPIKYSHDHEMAVEKVILPDSIQEGVPFKLQTKIRSTHDTKARLIIRRGGQEVMSQEVEIGKGSRIISVGLQAKSDVGGKKFLSGMVNYEVSIEPLRDRQDDDRISQNNTGYGFTRVHGPPTILYVDGNLGFDAGYYPQLHMQLVQELQLVAKKHGADKKGLPRLHAVAADNIPVASELAGYDAIILDNVKAEYLGEERMERIRALVNDQGTGLLMIGGDRSFGAGDYRNTPIEKALPVDMDLKHKKVLPNGALAIVLHTCEFPQGNMWGKRITKNAIKKLGSYDYIGVIIWDWSRGQASADTWLWPMQQVANRANWMMKKVDQCQPGDTPSFAKTINLVITALKKTKAAVKHIIIISDGDPSPPSIAERRRLKRDKTMTLSAIAIGTHSTPVMLKRLATKVGGGNFYAVSNPKLLPDIFIKEAMVVRKSLLFEKKFIPTLNGRSSTEFVRDILGAPLPSLYGYVRTTAKENAGVEVPLVSIVKDGIGGADRDPILAHWRYGLGQAVAFTSDAKNRWGKDWVGWDRYAKFYSGIVWRILRQRPANLRLATSIDGGRGRIVVQAIDKDGEPISFLNLIAGITTPSSKSLRVRLRQTGVNTYEGEFAANEVGQYSVAVTTPPEEKERAEKLGIFAAAYGGAAVPASAEAGALGPNEPLLQQMSNKGLGRMLTGKPEEDKVFNRNLPSARDFQDLWRSLLLLAVLLFPLDVFVRRVMIDYGAIWRKVHGRYLAWQGKPAPRAERMGRLMEAKQQALRTDRPRPEFALREDADSAAVDFDLSESAGNENSAGDGLAKPTAADEKETSADEPAEQTYTSRLLKAKKRAGRDRRKG